MKKDLIGSNFFYDLYKHNGYITFYGDFYLDGNFFFPISIKHELTCSELFGNAEQIKYLKYFNLEFYNDTLKNYNDMEIIKNSLILGSCGNYWHDLIDFYSKIFSYDKKIDSNIDNIIIGNLFLKDPIVTLLKKLNINKKLVNINSKTKIFKNSYFVSNKNVRKTNDFYRLYFMDSNLKQTKNIYISRKDSNHRKINNEDELINYLKQFDFEIYELSKLTFLEQIKIFNQAKMIVSMHGASLTNLMFCHPQTTVVEITADFYEQTKLSNFELVIDKEKFKYFRDNKTDWFSDINSKKFNIYTRSMYNYLSQMNGLRHYFYFVKKMDIKKDKLKSNINYSFQEITYTNLNLDIPMFKEFFSGIFK